MTILKHDPDEGCFGCPLWHDGPDVCAATGTEIEDNYPPAPPDCPLRLGPVGVVPPGWRAERRTSKYGVASLRLAQCPLSSCAWASAGYAEPCEDCPGHDARLAKAE